MVSKNHEKYIFFKVKRSYHQAAKLQDNATGARCLESALPGAYRSPFSAPVDKENVKYINVRMHH